MREFFRTIFTPPVFEDESLTYQARIVFNVAWLYFGIGLAAEILRQFVGVSNLQDITFIAGFIINVIALYILRRRAVGVASFLIIIATTLTIYTNSFIVGGLHRPVIFANVLILALSTLLFKRRGIIGTMILLVAGVALTYFVEVAFPASNATTPAPLINVAIVNGFIIIAAAIILQYSNANLNAALDRARAIEKQLYEKNQDLEVFSQGLEKLVAERTAELETASLQMQKRARQMETIAELARSITTIQDIDVLLPTVADLISVRFNFYHVGIFLLDSSNQYAMLRATNSEGGRRMLEREHKLRVEPSSLVGYAASRGQPRIALDVGIDAVYFNNPDLPETRSEMALPLRAGIKIIGVLDVQSTAAGAFSQEDTTILDTLANQVAIAIENARLFTETRAALEESEKAYRGYVQTGWGRMVEEVETIGYKYDAKGISVLNKPLDTPETLAAIAQGRATTRTERDRSVSVAVPIKLRDEVIGVLNVRGTEPGRELSPDENAMIRAVAERAALALENARLVEQSRLRAQRERTITEISARIGASIDVDEIMQAAAQELGRVIGDTQVIVQLGK